MNITAEKTRARLQAKKRRQDIFDPASGPELIRHFPAARFCGAVISGFWPLKNEIDEICQHVSQILNSNSINESCSRLIFRMIVLTKAALFVCMTIKILEFILILENHQLTLPSIISIS